MEVIDARGKPCPLPILELAVVIRQRPAGHSVELWATDPAAAQDVAAFCARTGHQLSSTGWEGTVQKFVVLINKRDNA